MDHSTTLPKSKIKITFRSPKVQDKRDVIREFSGEEDPRSKGYNLEESIAARCLTSVKGEKVNLENDFLTDPFDILNEWEFFDQQYFMELFSNLFYLDEKSKKAAAEEAKKIVGASLK